jgi:hypothetical protein
MARKLIVDIPQPQLQVKADVRSPAGFLRRGRPSKESQERQFDVLAVLGLTGLRVAGTATKPSNTAPRRDRTTDLSGIALATGFQAVDAHSAPL